MSNENTQAAPTLVPGSPEHEAAMIALADSQGVRLTFAGNAIETKADLAPAKADADEPAKVDDKPAKVKPEGVPDEFWNAEKGEVDYAAWGKATADLKAPKKETPAAKPPTAEALAATAAKTAATTARAAADAAKAKAAAPEATDADKAAATAAEAAAVKAEQDATTAQTKVDAQNAPPKIENVIASAGEEFKKDGKLSDASYEAFEKNGISRETVDAYIAGQKALESNQQAQHDAELKTVYAAAGGSKEEYEKVVKWVAANGEADAITQYNAMLASGDIAAIAAKAKEFRTQFDAAHGTDPKRTITPPNNGGTVQAHFANKQEMVAAMNSAAYRSGDAKFHAEVDRKMAESERLGINLYI